MVLDGITVLDLSQGAAGPTAGMILGDHGAEVIKVEPIGGEWGRALGPPFWHGTATAAVGMNRNKRSLALDLRDRRGQEVIGRLLRRCDVLLESFRPDVMERFGLAFEQLHETDPRLIYCSITAFGPSGPRRREPGVDGIAQAVSGLMSITGTEESGPVKVGVPAADMTAAFQAVQGVLLALLARERSGQGQRVEVSLFDSLLAFQLVPLTMYLQTREVPPRHGTGAAYSTPNEAYATKDGSLMIAAYTPDRWPVLCEALERPELADDPRFHDNAARMGRRAELREEIERVLRTADTDEWVRRFARHDLMCTPVADYERVMADPQVEENGMVTRLEHPLGTVETVGIPIKLSADPGSVRRPAPLPGEQSVELLAEVGYRQDEIDALLAAGIVATGPPKTSNPKEETIDEQ